MLINCTPHEVTVMRDGNIAFTLPPSGTVPRCVECQEAVGFVSYGGHDVPIVTSTFGNATGLPEQRPGVYLVVSQLVAAAAPERTDLLFPTSTVRDDAGRVVGCAGFGAVPR